MRKYWRGIAIAGVVAVISGCGSSNSSKNSINNGYIMETAAAAMNVKNENGEISGEGHQLLWIRQQGQPPERKNGKRRNQPKAE